MSFSIPPTDKLVSFLEVIPMNKQDKYQLKVQLTHYLAHLGIPIAEGMPAFDIDIIAVHEDLQCGEAIFRHLGYGGAEEKFICCGFLYEVQTFEMPDGSVQGMKISKVIFKEEVDRIYNAETFRYGYRSSGYLCQYQPETDCWMKSLPPEVSPKSHS